jgi:hypothetical protein
MFEVTMPKLRIKLAVTMTLLTLIPGCTYIRLQHSITEQATTLADLYYQQVLNNLAMFSVNPNVIPSHVSIRDGSAQIQDFGQLSLAGAFGRSMGNLATGSPTVTGSRTVVEQWGVSPVTDDIEVRIIQVAYQKAFGIPVLMDLDLINDLARELSRQTAETSDIDQRNELAASDAFREKLAQLNAYDKINRFITKMPASAAFDDLDIYINEVNEIDRHFSDRFITSNSDKIVLEHEYLNDASLSQLRPFAPSGGVRSIQNFTALARYARREVKDVQDDLVKIKTGWFQTGSKHDLPKDACYVGRYKDRYAWVLQDGVDELSQFTIKILKFSDLVKERAVLTVPGGPRFTPSAGR